ncbi:hypothetical protein CPB84DRAFT_1821402 [Gymnopilus junonius]|uniref:Uncharacterized protein n=1 Tax=Gymnopilus junonius TaxID=109634 RepID=A0A9P5NY58_GYMJU|nr:hypothetical protein CPB84DRAFT_1821402 [Gymnopilus junonius]
MSVNCRIFFGPSKKTQRLRISDATSCYAARDIAATHSPPFLGKDIGMRNLEGIFESAASHLVSLHFRTPEGDLTATQLRKTVFPLLQNISFRTSYRSHAWFNMFADVCQLPNLTSAMFSLVTMDESFPSNSLVQFCALHGARLFFFADHLSVSVRPRNPRPTCLGRMPCSGAYCCLSEIYGSLRHPNVRWVDIWTSPTFAEEAQELHRKVSSGNGLPALKGVRLLPYYLQESPYPIALLLPPRLVSTTNDTFSIQFLESGIRHDVGKIHYIQPDLVGGSDTDSADDDLVEDESGSSEDSDSSFDSESGSDLGITPDEDAEMDDI